MSSNCRRISTSQHPLRKQASLIDSVCGPGLVLPPYHDPSVRRSERFKYTTLQKQFSADQVFTINRSVRQKCGANRSNIQRGSVARTVVANLFRTSGGNAASRSSQQCGVNNESSSDNANLRIVPAIKKRVQYHKGHCDSKKDKLNAERARKSSKGNDDRLNLRIVLDQSITAEESCDIESSESSDDKESDEDAQSTPKEGQKPTEHVIKEATTKTVVQDQPSHSSQLTASSRRAQFLASRAADISSGSTAFMIVSTLSSSIERRSPLVRAMSAPFRPHDENSKNTLAAKRKIRRRKITTEQRPVTDFERINENVIVQNKSTDVKENPSEPTRGKTNKKSIPRTRSALGCDVVTLVSLISSEGSDSEKEESLIVIDTSRGKRHPLLRKSGKSVSFQDHELESFSNFPKEFPHMIRRGSVAPLAARLRANRPPTAPPGSVYMRGSELSEPKMATPTKIPSKEDTTTLSSSQGNSKENVPENGNSLNDYQYPDYVKTHKERECWKLFQKMSNKGITVSYDTVLRGMLTPTELRLLQKQKELEEAKKAKEVEEEDPQK